MLSTADGRWSLQGAVAIVTGASRGIGFGCARSLAAAGAAVLLVARTADDVERSAAEIVAHGGRAIGHVADVTDDVQVTRALSVAKEMGDIRVCVNSAGTNITGPATGYSMDDWDTVFSVNVRATFLVCRAVGKDLLLRGVPGSIINISSQMGSVGYPGRAAYCASKNAVEGLSKALAVEWAPHGIRVNSVAPTFVETDLTRPMLKDAAFRDEVTRRLPTGRMTTVDEIADAVRYLACPVSGNVTGSTLRVDGGWTAW
jgi:NAD(P)-dependent dehydrogenase (short-subunit alcohol dehydrogenase family)